MKIAIIVAGNAGVQASYASIEDFMRDFGDSLQLWQERLSAVVLISLGEIVAASVADGQTSSSISHLIVVSAIITAVACYVLYFSVQPAQWLPPSAVNYNMYSIESLGTLAVTCGLAAIGAAYGRLLEAKADAASSGRLLCHAVSIFLITSSARTFFGKCPDSDRVRYSGTARGFLRVVVGVLMGVFLPHVADVTAVGLGCDSGVAAAMWVPIYLVTLSAAEAWASRTVIRRVAAVNLH